MRLRLSLLLVTAALLLAPLSRAENCDSLVIDKAGVVRNPAVIASAARALINQGADVHAVVVDSVGRYGSTLADVETYFERSCPNWVNSSTGRRKENLFVVMVAPRERSKNMFLGSYYSGAFDIPSTYSRLSNSYFGDRQWEAGIASALQGTTSLALGYRQRTFSSQQRVQPPMPPQQVRAVAPPRSADSGVPGLAIFLVVLLGVVVAVVALYLAFREPPAPTTTGYDDYDRADGERRSTYPASGPYRSRSYTASAPSHTTVINNNPGGGDFVTGMVVGEMLSRPSQPSTVYVEPPAPAYVEPAPPAEPSNAPDSTWEDNTPSSAPDTDFGSSDSGSSSSDSSFGGDSGGGSGDSGF
jgi:uncharacterized membrane protein YgcG